MEDRKIDIYKSGGIIIQDKKFLVTRSKNKDIFVAPGGKPNPGETIEEALIRELQEEITITITTDDITHFGTFYAPAAGKEDLWLKMDVFIVNHYEGTIIPSSEIEEVYWLGASIPEGMKIGSIFEHEVLPRLQEQGLIE